MKKIVWLVNQDNPAAMTLAEKLSRHLIDNEVIKVSYEELLALQTGDVRSLELGGAE